MLRYLTPNGVAVVRRSSRQNYNRGLRFILRDLDRHRGVYLSSGYEYPGRYSRWDIAARCPPLEITARDRDMIFQPLNERGEVLTSIFERLLASHPHWEDFGLDGKVLRGRLRPMSRLFPEEERSKQPSAFSILRALTDEFRTPEDNRLALIGVFGYDLIFQFDPIEKKLPRHGHDDLHLFLCDEIYYADRKRERIDRYQYDFSFGELTTEGLRRTGARVARPKKRAAESISSDHTPEEYMSNVEVVCAGMRQGDFYEVVLRQTFRTTYSGKPSDLFERMQEQSPSPYEFLIQLGDEALVGASPEMFLRSEGPRIETCPMSGTARRTGDPLRDAQAIRDLLNSPKEESELTMCTDVDRNDKSRVCEPGSVKVVGRRLIESYEGLFHTVDHVEGVLKPGFDALDAFLSHMWAVTLIGAPKKAAAIAIENLEKDARGWYGGAIGALMLNGDINTGILIRTTYLQDGYATYPAGATLLYDSDPASEERETRLKASSFFRILGERNPRSSEQSGAAPGTGLKLLLVDHDDCFIHTLANYTRQTGADVVTYRWGFPLELLEEIAPDLVLISPGPGRPRDFGVPALVNECARRNLPVFGVCLGLQGIVEAFGGELGVLDYPMHGKPSLVRNRGVGVFDGMPNEFTVGRYHSLHAVPERLPKELEITAESADGVIMAIRHRELPVEAVQFHPESILSSTADVGLQLMRNAVRLGSRRLQPVSR